MKTILTIALIILCQFSHSFSQSLESLKGYKYISVPTLEYNGGIDLFDITLTTKSILQEKGFTVLSDEVQWNQLPIDLQTNPCLGLHCQIEHNAPNALANSVTITFTNCNGQVVFKSKGTGGMGFDLAGDFRIAVRKALAGIRNMTYSYNPSLTPVMTFPAVEKTTETEESIKEYLTNNQIDPIEGIYKSYQNETTPHYKIGVIKHEKKYKAIIIESGYVAWKPGEVKAEFEYSSIKGIYSVKWFMANKQAIETFCSMENEALLSIEITSQTSGEKRLDRFIKLFPLTHTEKPNTIDNPKSSGSGFLLTPDGIIATNAHVIEKITTLNVTFSTDLGNFTYKSKVLLVDKVNDVALLKIDDEKFTSLNNIPYGIVENAEVGSSVFTIGYPLNDVMGSNYKVTSGIISSITGISDDIRYYQITVPLQPGNSGGPLFNDEGNIIGITTARLNSQAVGIQVENVNYAIKSSYLLNLYKMTPNASKISTTSDVATRSFQDKIKVLKDYVCIIKSY